MLVTPPKMSRDSPNYSCPTDLSNMLEMTYLQSQKEVNKGQELSGEF